MKIITNNNQSVAIVARSYRLDGVQDILDLMGDIWAQGCSGMIVDKQCLNESFFDLKTGLAGAILQKFSNYRLRLAIVGDVSGYAGKSLRDFIYECNRGSLICFKNSTEAALEALTSA